jgi:PTH1 family peptidyl-tRNA hydrolase
LPEVLVFRPGRSSPGTPEVHQTPAGRVVWLVVGLGNPGREYEHNRHNVGYLVADLLAARTGGRFSRHRRAVADVAETRLGVGIDAPALVLVKPMTYMNLSGGPVAGLARFFKVPAERIIAVYDELDLPYGVVRAKLGGGEGGHNGVRSVSQSLSTRDYLRVRIGIGRPPGRQDPADFVLSDFTAAQRKELDLLVDRAADIVESLVRVGIEPTQNAFHAM